MKSAYVRARPGVRVPIEGAPRRHIDEVTPVRVALTAYYRRQIRAGDLLEVDAPAEPTQAATPAPAAPSSARPNPVRPE